MGFWTNELYHHGILGQKWGIRRYQNKDGTLTPEGKARYSINKKNNIESHIGYRMDKHARKVDKIESKLNNKNYSEQKMKRLQSEYQKQKDIVSAGDVLLQSYRSMTSRYQHDLDFESRYWDTQWAYQKLRNMTLNNMKKTDEYRTGSKAYQKAFMKKYTKLFNNYT